MENVRQIVVDIPVLENGSFDIEAQKNLLMSDMAVAELQKQIKELNDKLTLISNLQVSPN
jgi:hypothetical protein